MSIIISIDWDHTFRNTTGIDLNILALVLYAQSKQIAVGLTTHRDLENTTLYTLHAWQYGKRRHASDALAAAISYWDEHLFKPLHIAFDFINARYQSRHQGMNYYQDILLPLEKKLAEEIMENGILDDHKVVNEKIKEYAQPESFIENNEYKETQVLWLSDFFQHIQTPITLYHIDDSKDVCEQLPKRFSGLKQTTEFTVKTIFYENSPLFSNESCAELVSEIGLLNDVKRFMGRDEIEHMLYNQCQCLAIAMAVLQISDIDDDVFSVIEYALHTIKKSKNPEIINLYDFVEALFIETQKNRHPVSIMPNYLIWGHDAK